MGFYRFIALALFSCAFVLVQLIPTYAQNSPQVYVSLHNSARAAVGVGPIKWNKRLADYAQNYANKRKGDCRLIYSGGPYGENIYRGSGPAVCTAAHAVRSWLSEKKYYNYQSNTCQRGKKCRHYTQVVCRKSVMLGCASVTCKNKACFIICLYFPRCNVDGRRPY